MRSVLLPCFTTLALGGCFGRVPHDMHTTSKCVAPPAAPSPSCFVDPVYSTKELQVRHHVVYGANFNNQTRKNQTLTLDIYQPPASDTRSARPAMVLVHGGSFETGSSISDDEPAFAQNLVTRGFVAVSINYRLTGAFYGLESEQPPLDAAEDARAAIRYLRKNAASLRIDVDRIGIAGDSAGAITSLYVGYVKDAAREGSSGNPGFSSAVRVAVPVSGELKAQAFCKINSMGEPYDCQVDGTLDKTSDIDSSKLPPLAMIHGTSDSIVPYVNAQAVIAQANKVGLENLLITIPGAQHVPFEQLFTQGTYLVDLLEFLVKAMDLDHAQCPHTQTQQPLADPPVFPEAPYIDCGSTGFNISAAYFQQLSASKMINGFDATATRDFTNATFSVSVQYPGKKPMAHSFGVCTVARFHIDGFPPCPWQPGTKLHIIDHNPAHRDGPAEYESTWTMIDSENNTLFCMKTNWTLRPMS